MLNLLQDLGMMIMYGQTEVAIVEAMWLLLVGVDDGEQLALAMGEEKNKPGEP